MTSHPGNITSPTQSPSSQDRRGRRLRRANFHSTGKGLFLCHRIPAYLHLCCPPGPCSRARVGTLDIQSQGLPSPTTCSRSITRALPPRPPRRSLNNTPLPHHGRSCHSHRRLSSITLVTRLSTSEQPLSPFCDTVVSDLSPPGRQKFLVDRKGF